VSAHAHAQVSNGNTQSGYFGIRNQVEGMMVDVKIAVQVRTISLKFSLVKHLAKLSKLEAKS